MKVSTRQLIRKNANWQRSIVANYVGYLEEAQQYLEKQMSTDTSSSSNPMAGPLDVYQDIGKAVGLIRHVANGLRAYFLEEEGVK